tara:strand:+ start:3484 stop:4302 length:819 start_codon:yes stop_codon:yes gene_type:complete
MSSFYIKVTRTDLSLVGKPVNISLSSKPINIGLSAAFSVITVPSLNQSFTNSAIVLDINTLSFGKPVANSMAVTEQSERSVTKPLSDSLNATEGNTLLFGLVKGDGAGFADDELFANTKALSDGTGLADLNILTIGKTLADSWAGVDLASLGAGKVFTNNFSLGDGDTLGIGKKPSDSAAWADAINSFAFGLTLADTTFVTDDADGVAGDDSAYTFVKTRTNLSALTDDDTISFTGVKNDAFGLADAGSGRSQGYCSLDYFLEDYVGSVWTF